MRKGLFDQKPAAPVAPQKPEFRIVINPPDGKPLTGSARWIDDQFKSDLKGPNVIAPMAIPDAPKEVPAGKFNPATGDESREGALKEAQALIDEWDAELLKDAESMIINRDKVDQAPKHKSRLWNRKKRGA